MFRRAGRAGITLMQVLIVLIVLALLIALLLPGVQKVREAAARTVSTNNLKNLMLAVHTMHDNHLRLPPSVGKLFPNQPQPDATFFFYILPYIEQENAFRQGQTNIYIRIYQAENRDPSADKAQSLTSYATNLSVFGDGKNIARLAAITKGLSNTIGVAERFAVVGEKEKHLWGDVKPGVTYIDGVKSDVEFGVTPATAKNTTAHALQGPACMVGLMDGSVRSLTMGIKTTTFQWACDPNNPNPAPADW